jgi:hypothetical protein
MAAPVNAPIAPGEFDYRDPEQLRVMLAWAGCDRVLAEYAGCSESTISKNRRKHKINAANDTGRLEFEPVSPAGESAENAEHLAALLEYFEGRVVPPAPKPTAAKVPGEYAKALVVADLHYPFVDRRALEVVIGLGEVARPDEVIVNGDAFDFAQISRFVKRPDLPPIQSDIDQCREDILAPLGALAPVRRFIVGNHEQSRWQNYLFTRCPEISSLRCLTMEAVLGLTEMGWAWQPWEYWPTDSLCVYHGDRHTSALGGGSAMSARKEQLDMGCSTLTGHTHHAGAFFRQDRAGYRVSYEIGWLGDAAAMQAAGCTTHRTPTKAHDWHQACALIHYKPEHSAFLVELIPILSDSRRTFAIYQDQEIIA